MSRDLIEVDLLRFTKEKIVGMIIRGAKATFSPPASAVDKLRDGISENYVFRGYMILEILMVDIVYVPAVKTRKAQLRKICLPAIQGLDIHTNKDRVPQLGEDRSIDALRRQPCS